MRHLLVTLALVAAPAAAATPLEEFDVDLVKAHPTYAAGDVKGVVTAAKSTGCETKLTLDGKRSVSVDWTGSTPGTGAVITIDGDPTVTLTFASPTAAGLVDTDRGAAFGDC